MEKYEVTIRADGKPVDNFVAAKTVATRIIAEHMDLVKEGAVLEIKVSKHDGLF